MTRLKTAAENIAEETFQRLRAVVASTYQQGEGTLASTLQKRVFASREGVGVEFSAGGRHLVYLTALAGAGFASPGHFIPHNGRSRFYWRNPLHGLPPGMYSFTSKRPAFWKPRLGRGDVMADVLGAGAQRFTETMIREHETALVEFVQNDLAPVTRSPRVNVAAR